LDPRTWLGSRGPRYKGAVYVQAGNSSADLLRDAIFDPRPLADALDLRSFTGRDWLVQKVDEAIARLDRGYVLVQAEAGVGKSCFAAHLAWTSPCAYHFTALEGATSPEQARRSIAAQLMAGWQLEAELCPDGTFPAGADRPDWLVKVIYVCARKRDAVDANQPIVIVVDGLDEADHSAHGRDTGVPLELPKEEHLPNKVYIMATSRFGLPILIKDPIHLKTIPVDGGDNIRDKISYLNSLVDEHSGDRLILDRLVEDRTPLSNLLPHWSLNAEEYGYIFGMF
jgi:hypothetical protein